MSSTTSPNMGLIVPTVGSEPSPTWANDLNADWSIVDGHDHSSGKGVQITPSGLSINSDLTFQNNNAILLKSSRFSPQSVTIPNSGSDVGCLYVSGNELYYNDVTGGHQIQVTNNGSVNAGAGSITGLPSGTASASYAAGTFTWQSATSTSAVMDAGSYILRNATANSKGLTLQPPNAMAADYSLTLPSVPASVTSIMRLDTSGNMSANLTVDGTTIQISGNQLVATTQLTAASQTEVNVGTNTTKFINPATLAGKTNVAIFNTAGTYTWTAPAGVNSVVLIGRGGSGGGGGGGGNANAGQYCGGAGGAGVASNTLLFPVTPGTQYTVVVGAGGAGGTGDNAGGGGQAGGNGIASSFAGQPFRNIGAGGAGGLRNSTGTSAGGSATLSWGGSGGTATTSGAGSPANGGSSIFGDGGSGGGTFNLNSVVGGGGGGAGDSNGGAGGQASASPTNGQAGSTGGGGGGGCGGSAGNNATNGGKGSDGQVVIIYENVSITNTNT